MKAQRLVALLLMIAILSASDVLAAAPGEASALSPEIQSGKVVYLQHCAACHGVNGDGSGLASVWLFPRPRNFNAGLFKIKSTPGTALPTDEDLFRTLTRGMPGSSMPSFTYLTEADRRATVQYVKHLTATTDASGKRVNFFAEAQAKGELGASIQVPPEPPITIQGLTQGQGLYSKLQCFTCHGETGEGTGPQAPLLK